MRLPQCFVTILCCALCAPLGAEALAPASQTPDRPTQAAPRVLLSLPEFILLDQEAHAFGTEQLLGQVWIANFIFTRCPTICPRTTQAMLGLQRGLRDQGTWPGLRLVSFSVDPDYDRPQVLRAFAQTHGADPEHWKFLTGTRGQLERVVRDGFKLPLSPAPVGAEMPIVHSQHFVLMDRESRVRGLYDALENTDLDRLRADLSAVLADPGPTVVTLPLPGTTEEPQLEERQKAQLASDIDAFHGFRFTDQIAESGITFRHRVTDDSGRRYKPVHYDHANGIPIADVDGDGRPDVLFINQIGSNELWRNLGGGSFENLTEHAGIALPDVVSVSGSFADVDNDGDPDLFVTTVRGGNHLFLNDGSGAFTDVTLESGLDYAGHSSGAVFFDYDRDGLLDLFLSNVGIYTTDERGADGYYVGYKDAFAGHLKPRDEASKLYHNEGDHRFEDVTREAGLLDFSWTGDASPLDVNEDGWPDLYLLNMQGNDQYYENAQGRRFVKKSRDVFPKTPWGAMGVKSFDADNDGDMDILITDMHSDMSQEVGAEQEALKAEMLWPESYLQSGGLSVFGNAFFRNDGEGRFSEVSDTIGAENFWPWGPSVGDLNADGYQDVFVASAMNYPFRYGINTVLLSEHGEHFAPAEFVLGVEPRRGARTSQRAFELDCSGEDRDEDLVCNKLGLSGRVVVEASVGSRSSAIFDIDDDGDLDIVTSEFGDFPMVLVSDLTARRRVRYLKVRLIGTVSNRDGLGARVSIEVGDQKQYRVYDGVSGYLSHSLYPLYFGIGNNDVVAGVEVHWPSGTVQQIPGPIKANQTLDIVEPPAEK